MYLNFELQILELEGGVYLAKVLDAPHPLPDERPSQRFAPPYDDNTLRRIMLILSGERRPRGELTRREVARQFGEGLFQAVFAGDVYAAYQEARRIALVQDVGLRFRLNLQKAGNFASLPWEFLRDPKVDYLTLSRSTPIVRYTTQVVNKQRLQVARPLRILVMISAPTDVPAVDEAAERRNMERALIRLRQEGLIDVDYLEDASLRTLQRVLRQGEYHIFHYIGHSVFDPQSKTGTLLLEDPITHQKSVRVRGEALARELHEEETLRLVVLNSCQGALSDYRDPFSGVASSLVQRGIPAVVAQQFEITDRAAIAFSEEFYRAVAEGFSIEAAVAEGRRAIVSELPMDNIEWATPVLFLYDNNSQRIFDFPPTKQPSAQRLRQRFLSRDALPQTAAILGAVLILLLVVVFSGLLSRDDDVRASFAPPTATPVPNVDLVVSDVRLSPRNPQPGDFVAVFVDIENRGSDPSPAFSYEWQGNIFDPASTLQQRVNALAPGGILRDNLTFRYGWWGVFISEARVDTLNEIIEDSEQNSRPSPVRTDNSLPFIIDFNEPLPNGSFVRQNQPVPFNIFEPWGFTIEAEAPDNPACVEVVPWFKFVGISRIALGTGLPTDPQQCTDEVILITFLPQRADNNPSGVSSFEVDFAPGTGMFTLDIFADVARQEPLDSQSARGSRREELTLATDPNLLGFNDIFRARITSDGAPLGITGLVLSAP